jgi:hypothetical protein
MGAAHWGSIVTHIRVVGIPRTEGAEAGAVAAVAGIEPFVIDGTASSVVNDATCELIGIAAVTAWILPAFAPEAHGALGHVTVAVIVVVGVPVSAAGVYHGDAPVLA